MRRAEKELQDRGEYSWTADIRARVRIARSVSRSESEFRSLLGALGVTVSDNSPRAQRRDWIYALADRPTRRVSGERLGLSCGRERLEPLLHSGSMGRIPEAGERAVADVARRAVEVGNLEELSLLSKTVDLIEAARISNLSDLDALAERDASSNPRDIVLVASYARAAGLLPERRTEAQPRKPAEARTTQRGAVSERDARRIIRTGAGDVTPAYDRRQNAREGRGR